MAFKFDFVVKEHHLDFYKHVNNVAYLLLLDEARWQMLADRGVTLDWVEKNNVGPITLEINLKFERELLLRNRYSILSTVTPLEGLTGFIKQEIVDESGKVCARASIRFGIFDKVQRRLVTMPPEWSTAFGLE